MYTLTEEAIEKMGFTNTELKVTDSRLFNVAIEWLGFNTDLDKIDENDPVDAVASLSSGVHLFIVKFIEMMKNGALSSVSNVTSESIAGMSKSFGSQAEANMALLRLAQALLGDHYTGMDVKTVMDYSRWQSWA